MHNLLHYCKIAHEYMTFDTHTNLIMLTIQTPKLRNSIVSIIKNFHNKRQNRKFCSIAEFLLFFSVHGPVHVFFSSCFFSSVLDPSCPKCRPESSLRLLNIFQKARYYDNTAKSYQH